MTLQTASFQDELNAALRAMTCIADSRQVCRLAAGHPDIGNIEAATEALRLAYVGFLVGKSVSYESEMTPKASAEIDAEFETWFDMFERTFEAFSADTVFQCKCYLYSKAAHIESGRTRASNFARLVRVIDLFVNGRAHAGASRSFPKG